MPTLRNNFGSKKDVSQIILNTVLKVTFRKFKIKHKVQIYAVRLLRISIQYQ